ncbi:hypothetical protein R6242_14720 [Iodobacter sp. CM08]|nr:hypothetical protein [Iodobacter sp. CM08]MDW5417822.1 hypothetical protein [Iodobacter sp. CM08]
MSTPLKALISRLTPTARRAVEEAASRALSRTDWADDRLKAKEYIAGKVK